MSSTREAGTVAGKLGINPYADTRVDASRADTIVEDSTVVEVAHHGRGRGPLRDVACGVIWNLAGSYTRKGDVVQAAALMGLASRIRRVRLTAKQASIVDA